MQINQQVRHRDQCLPHHVKKKEKEKVPLGSLSKVLDVRRIHLVKGVLVKLKSSRPMLAGSYGKEMEESFL